MSSLSFWQIGAAVKAITGGALVVGAVWGAIRMGWGIDGQAEHDKAIALSDPRCRRRFRMRDAVLMKSLRAIKRRGDLLTYVHGQRRS